MTCRLSTYGCPWSWNTSCAPYPLGPFPHGPRDPVRRTCPERAPVIVRLAGAAAPGTGGEGRPALDAAGGELAADAAGTAEGWAAVVLMPAPAHAMARRPIAPSATAVSIRLTGSPPPCHGRSRRRLRTSTWTPTAAHSPARCC